MRGSSTSRRSATGTAARTWTCSPKERATRSTSSSLCRPVLEERGPPSRRGSHARSRRGGPMSNLLDHDVLVISQKAKLIEMTNEYRVFDAAGTEIGTIREVEQSTTK